MNKNNNLLDHPLIKPYVKNVRIITKIILKRSGLKKNAELTWTGFVGFLDALPKYFANGMVQIVSILTALIILSLIAVFFQVGNRFDKNLYIINIPKGYGAYQVADLLQSRKIIDGKYGFDIIVNLFGLQDKMQAGTYEFTPSMPLIKIVFRISRGDIVPPLASRLILPEGISIYKMGRAMQSEGVGDGADFQQLTNMPIKDKFKVRYPYLADVPINSLEGYLFPDTYYVPSNIMTDQFIDIMLSRFDRVIMPYWKKNHKKMKVKMTLHQILTLASIIEKEAQIDAERPIIASVYHNRLKVRMHLGADPTIKYVLEHPGKIVSLDDLKVDSPYNTYRRYGLPPGPICSPGLSSVKAAMFPAETDYIYFVARADGSHVFTRTWQEHEAAKSATRQDRVRKIFRKVP